MLEIVFVEKVPADDVVKVIAMYEKTPFKADFLKQSEAKQINTAIVQSGFDGKLNETADVYGGKAKTVLAGLGKKGDKPAVQKAGAGLFGKLFNDERACIVVDDDSTALELAFGILLGSYSFDKYKTEKKPGDFPKLEQVCLVVKRSAEAYEKFKPLAALATAVRYCKDLSNEPASFLTPEVFASDIKRLEYLGLDVDILSAKEIKENGLGLVEAVAKGAANEPKVVVISWKGNRSQKEYDLGLVGKGVCFDAGGLSLKSNAGMLEMKMDMAGAAAIAAAMKAAALQRIRKNLIAVVGLVENMPDGNAMKIGDVYTSYSGKTVEIMNADAEGRLVVADCLSYLQKNYKVKTLVDLATLGSLRTVLGNVYAAVFATDNKLADMLTEAGEACNERLWKMPLDTEYEQMLASSLADMRNIAVDGKASIVSAAFLNRFIEKGIKWAHIDMSGVRLDKSGLASGFGVRLLNEFIKGL